MRNEELRELDAAIATELGYEVVKVDVTQIEDIEQQFIYSILKGEKGEPLPHYSTDGNAMLELDKEMRERGYCVNVECLPPIYCAEYWKLDADGNEMELVAAKHHEKEEIARALAAYKALTGKEWGSGDND